MTELAVIASEATQSRAHRPSFVVHTLSGAVAALTAAVDADQSIILLSARDAGISAGAGWFSALVAAARAAVPSAHARAILDCGDDAGAAQAALRTGIESIVFTGRPDIAARLADIAHQQDAHLLTHRPPALLDLEHAFFANADTLHAQCAVALRDSR